MTYTEDELFKMTNAGLNRIIDDINKEIKRRKGKRPRLKKGGNKKSKVDRILAYYAPKPKEPEPEPEQESEDEVEEEDEPEPGPTEPEEEPESTDAETFYNKTFQPAESQPKIIDILREMKSGFLNDKEFIRWGYLKILGREPDSVGMSVYKSHFKHKTLNREGFIQALFASDEYRGKRDDGFFDKPIDKR